MTFGRTEILTDVEEINENNILAVLRDAMQIHTVNADRMEFLIQYEAGNQPLKREKTYRSDIDVQVSDNVANEVTEFKCGYIWSNPITLVQRGIKDSGLEKESEAIALLNECYEADNTKAKTQQIGYFAEITGVCNEYIDINFDYEEGESYFTTTVLDPRKSFVVKSSYYIDKRDMMGVTYRTDSMNLRHYTCITKDAIYTIFEDKIEDITPNPFGVINIVEWKRSVDRMGCFERQIDEMDNLNLIVSDFSNDIDQNTQAIWHGNDIDFPVDENGNQLNPKTNDWVLTQTTPNGKTPFVKPLAVEYDYNGMLNNIVTRRSLILQKCNVPQRNNDSGGSTGLAMSDATGWSAAEMSASKQQPLQEESKMKELKVVMAILRVSPDVPQDSPLLSLRYGDLQPNIKRQKTYELTVKTNAICALLAKGFTLKDALSVAPLFDDPQQVVLDSGEGVRKFQEASVFANKRSDADESTGLQDVSDQIENSPRLDE